MIKSLNKTFLIISILPFIFTIYIACINFNKSTSVTILTLQTKERSLGLLILIGSITGFTGSLLTFLPSNTVLTSQSRRVSKTIHNIDNNTKDSTSNDSLLESDNVPLDTASYANSSGYNEFQNEFIERDIRDPSPTISVPYRIIKDSSNHKHNFIQNKDIIDDQEYNNSNYRDPTLAREELSKEEDWVKDLEEQW